MFCDFELKVAPFAVALVRLIAVHISFTKKEEAGLAKNDWTLPKPILFEIEIHDNFTT